MPEWNAQLQAVLLTCFLINTAILVLWFVLFLTLRESIYRLHSRWFPMSENQFVMIHYALMGGFKLLNALGFLVPWCALLLLYGRA